VAWAWPAVRRFLKPHQRLGAEVEPRPPLFVSDNDLSRSSIINKSRVSLTPEDDEGRSRVWGAALRVVAGSDVELKAMRCGVTGRRSRNGRRVGVGGTREAAIWPGPARVTPGVGID
jgi:hypothetical protein